MHIDVKTMLTHFIADAEKDAGMKTLKIEEAITILEDMKVNISIPKAAVTQIKRNAALNMAIDALLKCSEIPNDSDTISRQAAVELAMKYCPDDDGAVQCDGDIRGLLDELENLPSVQPELAQDLPSACADAISRQAAIDALDIAIERYDEIAEKYRKKADIERNDYMDMRDNAYEAQQLAQWLNELKYLREKIEQITIKTEPKWIPVSERMPELDEDGYSEKVLVCFDRVSFCEICEYRTDKWYIGDMEDSPEDIGLRVIAWMPLPAPYKGGETE